MRVTGWSTQLHVPMTHKMITLSPPPAYSELRPLVPSELRCQTCRKRRSLAYHRWNRLEPEKFPRDKNCSRPACVAARTHSITALYELAEPLISDEIRCGNCRKRRSRAYHRWNRLEPENFPRDQNCSRPACIEARIHQIIAPYELAG